MRTELEIRRELKEIEALMEGPHANNLSAEVAYGAYRALAWALSAQLGARLSASDALETMEAWAVHRETERVRELKP